MYLRDKHKSGWEFTKVNFPGIYHFRKCTPEDVIYQLDYNQDSQKHPEQYRKIFSDCGWEHITDYVGYSYFRRPANEGNLNEGIFWDDESKLDMMKRVLYGRLLPLLIIFLCILLPQLVINIFYENYFIVPLIGAVLLLYISVFVNFAYQFKKMLDS